jgi:molecular chaperone DnaK (HSP70)
MKTAEETYRDQVRNAVITVTIYSNDAQREDTEKDAGRVGLNGLRVVNESSYPDPPS